MNKKAFATLALALKSIRLPLLNLHAKELDCAEVAPELRAYWHHYGFDALLERHRVTYSYGSLPAATGSVACHYWQPETPRAAIMVVHGLFDHVGIYHKLIDYLLSRNFAVFAFDLPGHGLSEGEPTVIDSFDTYADCLAKAIKVVKQHSLLPLYGVGQSTGAAIIADYVLTQVGHDQARHGLEGAVLLSPLIYPRKWWLVFTLYWTYRWMLKRVRRGFSDSSYDKDFCQFLAYADPLQSKYLSVSWVGAMVAWIKKIPLLPVTDLPTLIIQGSDDGTVDAAKNIPIYRTKFSASDYISIKHADHQLVNELPSVREDIFSRIDAFISGHLY